MKVTGSHCDFDFGILNLLIQMSRVFGLAPVSLGIDGIRISRAIVIYSRMLIIAMNIILIAGLTIDVLVGQKLAIRMVSPVEGGLWLVNVFIVTMLASDGIYNAPGRIFSIVDTLKAINKVYLEVGADCEQHKHFTLKKIRIALVSVMFTVIILLIADYQEIYYNASNKHKEIKAMYFYVSFYAEYCIVIILEMQFVVLMYMPFLGLKFVNFGLQKLLKEYPEQVNAELSYRNCVKIRQLSKHYVNMCKIVRGINKSNGCTLLCIMTMLLLDFVINVYYWIAYKAYYRDIFIVESFWCIFHVVTTTLLLKPIHKTQLEIQKTHNLLSSLIHRTPMEMAVKLELDQFVHHLILNDVSYSPMGIFTISTSLVIATASGMTSYIVLIVRLELG